MDEIVSVFIQESRDQLAEMEKGLLALEQNPDDRDNINAIFRAAHTIKGGSGVIECHFIEKFTHSVENILDCLRNGEIAVNAQLTTLLLECCDHLGLLLDLLANGGETVDEATGEAGEALALRLKNHLPQAPAESDACGGLAVAEAEVEVESSASIVVTDAWHVSVRFGEHVMRRGINPLSFIHYLSSLGEIVGIETLADQMPYAEEMDPEACYLGFEIQLQTRVGKAEIERVFDFVADECELRILPPNSKLAEYVEHIQALPEDNMRLGEILVRCGALTPAELARGLDSQLDESPEASSEAEPPARPLGEILVDNQVVHKEVVDAAVVRQSQINDKKAKEAKMVRVQADKLDRLIDLVGELVIAGASTNLLAQKSRQSRLVEATSVLSRLVEDIRDSALQLRMVQIGETFNRFQRVVRDVSRELGKEIELEIHGAETELDKTVIEKIGDPLMHLVRNALDHGIEPAAVRLERGKPVCGRVSLNAFHDSGNIVIQIADDGGGLNREKSRPRRWSGG